MRAFVAVPVPANHPVATALQGELAAGPWRMVTPGRRHLTLRFLGEVPDDALPDLARRLEDALGHCAGFPLEIAGLDAFPSLERPDVLWLACGQGAETLAALAEAVRAGLRLPLERGGFHGHVTVARRRPRIGSVAAVASLADALPRWRKTHWGSLMVGCVQLLASELRPDGALYTPLVTLRLP